jgi:hypothetical protein
MKIIKELSRQEFKTRFGKKKSNVYLFYPLKNGGTDTRVQSVRNKSILEEKQNTADVVPDVDMMNLLRQTHCWLNRQKLG